MGDILNGFYFLQFFTSLDLKSGYWQIEMERDHLVETAFITTEGLYPFCAMPFGLKGAAATFQQLMNEVLRGLVLEICFVR